MKRVIRKHELLKILGVSESTLLRMRRSGEFPSPVQIYDRCVGWLSTEVFEWLESRPTA